MNITRKRNSCTISIKLIDDPRIEAKTLGVFLILYALPDFNDETLTSISKRRNITVNSLKKGLLELAKYKYVTYNKEKDRFTFNSDPGTIVEKIVLPAKETKKLDKAKVLENLIYRKTIFKEFTDAAVHSIEKDGKHVLSFDLIRNFKEYWTEFNPVHPEHGMRFEKKQPFNHKLRLITFLRLEKKRNQEKNDKL